MPWKHEQFPPTFRWFPQQIRLKNDLQDLAEFGPTCKGKGCANQLPQQATRAKRAKRATVARAICFVVANCQDPPTLSLHQDTPNSHFSSVSPRQVGQVHTKRYEEHSMIQKMSTLKPTFRKYPNVAQLIYLKQRKPLILKTKAPNCFASSAASRARLM